MNSAPGATDGAAYAWIDDVRRVHCNGVAWTTSHENAFMNYWNAFWLGGNVWDQYAVDGERHEDWYAIDDLKVSYNVPKGLGLMEDD